MARQMRITMLFREGECPEAFFDAIITLGKRHCTGHLRAILFAHYDGTALPKEQPATPATTHSESDMDNSMREAFGDSLNLTN